LFVVNHRAHPQMTIVRRAPRTQSLLTIDPGYVRKELKQLRAAACQRQQLRKKARGLRRERMYDRRAWRGHIGD
jgi:hypothetical protein